jgi:hypothetical protein
MTRKHNGYTISVTKVEDGYSIIVTRPNGGKIFDHAFTQAKAWEVANRHAGI